MYADKIHHSNYQMVVSATVLEPYDDGFLGKNIFWSNPHYPHSITALKKIDLSTYDDEVKDPKSYFRCVRK